jgi:predicted nucleic acid-binding protein
MSASNVIDAVHRGPAPPAERDLEDAVALGALEHERLAAVAAETETPAALQRQPARGRRRLPAIDSMLAATALTHGLTTAYSSLS